MQGERPRARALEAARLVLERGWPFKEALREARVNRAHLGTFESDVPELSEARRVAVARRMACNRTSRNASRREVVERLARGMSVDEALDGIACRRTYDRWRAGIPGFAEAADSARGAL